ncbi:MAG: rhomboid family intramembrane serine protease [Myxococcales bacterium]|nr:MAG: rhomboid family intramembrane serine protease [Myxococcales bacterium]
MVLSSQEEKEVRQVIGFQLSYSKQDIKATWALAAVIVALYLLEEYFGGSTNTAVLVRMGANVKSLVAEGQYVRLMSSVFLHAGFMHVFFNTYVLFALGGFFNRILGEAKYLMIFFASGIGGSISSFFWGKGLVSVGASGALWGLFGASVGLAFFKNSIIPDLIRVRLRKITLINLAINLGVSFLPMVDMWAHFGGGIAGFLLSLVIIFNSKNNFLNRVKIYFIRMSALVLALAYLYSIIFVIISFKPWTNKFDASLEQVALEGVPFSLSLPLGLTLKKSEAKDHHQVFIFGDISLDQMIIELQFFKDMSLGQGLAREWLQTQQRHLLSDAKVGSDLKRSIDFRTPKSGPELFYKLEPQSALAVFTYIIVRESYVIKIAVITESSTKQAQVENLAHRIIESLKSFSKTT